MNKPTCNRCNSPLVGRQTKYCSHACANQATAKQLSKKAALRPWNKCSILDCAKPARSRVATLCPMHYHRQYRYGTLDRITDLIRNGDIPRRGTDISGVRYGTLIAEAYRDGTWLCRCDCGNTRLATIGELKRTGEANTCGVRANHLSEDIDYSAAHGRVHRAKGQAQRHRCVDCGDQAKHWSYDHSDPNEYVSRSPRTIGIAFSLDANHYEPRCVPCHKTFDLGRLNGTHLTRSM
ncbi:hypothetical protein GCM10009651_36460 [Microbacterium natoriense]